MAASQFGALTPLQHYTQQQQQQHYSQLGFQPPPAPLPPPPPSQQRQQQHVATIATVATVNHAPNGSIQPLLPSQPRSPALNGASVGPLDHQQLQTAPGPVPVSSLNPGLANPSAIVTAIATAPPIDSPAPSAPQRRRHTASRPSKRRRSDNDVESVCSPVPPHPRPPTVHPFSKGPYATLEDAIFSLQLHVFSSGYGVSQKRTVKEKLPSGKYDPDGDIIRKDFACDKGGNEFVSQSRGERQRKSKKCGCAWKAAIRRLRREGDRWFIEILEAQHNHPVTLPDEMHTLASYRRWQRENNAGIRSAIARLGRAAAMPARDIAAYLKGDTQDHDLDRIDRQILRALSMNDKEVPVNDREGGSVVFEMVARRPVIILQDDDRTSTTANRYLSAPNPSPPINNFSNPTTSTVPFDDPSATYHNNFANTFTNPSSSHPLPPPPPLGGGGGTANMHSGYSVAP